ncbi:MAG: hypothetical protein KGH54_03475, partial [Candidatus Micrarchaeota archaeon]|nr:hypothetical protein [Candidatus Micrarchaeota archaeon]
DKRLVIIYRTAMGLRKYYEIIPYRRITSVRIEHGIMSSSLHLNILGVDKGKVLKEGKAEGVIEGLRAREAAEFAKFLNQKLMDAAGDRPQSDTSDVEEQAAPMFCRTCGARESALSRFCRSCGAALGT